MPEIYFQDPESGQTFVFDEEPDPAAIRSTLVRMTAEEVAAIEPPAALVPQKVSARQIRKALNQLGKRSLVEDFVATQSQDIKDDWEFANEFERDYPLLNALAAVLGLDLDAIFILADTL